MAHDKVPSLPVCGFYGTPDNPNRQVFEAAQRGDAAVLNGVLQQMNASERTSALETWTIAVGVECRQRQSTPLIIAALNGNLDCVKILLRYKADIEGRGDDFCLHCPRSGCTNCTPLMIASEYGHVNVVTFLLERGAKMDLQDKQGKTALHYAVRRGLGSCDILLCLVKNGADINARTNDDCTPLMIASKNGHVSAVTFLVEHRANMDLQDKEGNTALHYAVIGNATEVCNKLLTLGASLQLYNNDQLTPLLLASNESKIQMVEELIKRPECTKEQRIDALELLGASLVITDTFSTDDAFEYMKRGMEERFQDPSHPLLKQSVELFEAYQNRKESHTLEELAQIEGNDVAIGMESLLIRERIFGADNIEPLRILACWLEYSGHFDICLLGLYRRAINLAQRFNQSAVSDILGITRVLHWMIQNNSPPREEVVLEVLERLLVEYTKQAEKFPSLNLKRVPENVRVGERELRSALFCCFLELLQVFVIVKLWKEGENSCGSILLRILSRLNPRDNLGNTLLHLAAGGQIILSLHNVPPLLEFPCTKLVKLLLKAGISVNVTNANGDTPLHRAVTFTPRDHKLHVLTDVLEVLLDGGAHHDFVNNDGKTAMDLAATDEARRILSERKTLDLKCIAARAVKKFGLPFLGMVPKVLEKYLNMH